MQSFEVPLRADWMVLDALNYIKDQLDGSLAFRWSCRMGICGSCGMMVNGVPKLTCETLLMNFAPGPVRVGPLDHFPVVKDLVVEMDDFLAKLQKVRPWIVRKDDFKPEREFIQTPAQLDKFKQFSLCINCTLCYAACPVYGLDPNFIGPAAMRARPSLQPRFTRSGHRGASRYRFRSTRASGIARWSANARRSVPSTSIRRSRFSSTSSPRPRNGSSRS